VDCFAVIVLEAADEESTFWIKLLMLVVIGAGLGVYFLFKSRNRAEQQTRDEILETIIEPVSLAESIQPFAKKRDLAGGMELLSRDFLAGVVEQTASADNRHITIRKLCFNELSRRNELSAISSAALKIYTLDEDSYYGKTIRCQAMAELAARTLKEQQNAAEISARSSTHHVPASSTAHNTR